MRGVDDPYSVEDLAAYAADPRSMIAFMRGAPGAVSTTRMP
jgi:hypothetical protein